jgi:hypothetical protein
MHQVNLQQAQSLFISFLTKNASEDSLTWLKQKADVLKTNFSEKDFYLAFSLLSRHFSKDTLKLPDDYVKSVSQLRQGFDISGFTSVQSARVFLVLAIPTDDKVRFVKILNNLFSTGEVNELVALYSALPLLSYPESLKARGSEGIRTNMTVVFDAIALNNPYPADFLDDDAFNQMVLKAVFIERPLDKIYGLDTRANENLARMLSDYAHERWAASRYVTPELWRPVGPFIDDRLLKDIERLLEQGSELEKQAAVLAVKSSKLPKAAELLPAKLRTDAEKKEFDWHTISKRWFAEKIR